jgi:type IV secretion system protein VirB5
MRWYVTALALLAGVPAYANLPVFDATNFAELVRNVEVLQQQLVQLKATYDSLHGSRGLGAVLYNPALRQYLPEEWAGIYDAVAAGRYAGISGSLRDIERAERLTGTMAQQIGSMQRRERSTALANKALGIRAYDGARQRLDEIESLMHQVNLTQDEKGAAEIQARIAVEQAAVANETTKLQLVQMLQQAEEKLAAQQRHEVAQKILDPAVTGSPPCCSAR